MEFLIGKVSSLKNHPVSDIISSRISEFESFRNPNISLESLFKELCFCLLTANYTAIGGLRIQEALGDKFLTLNVDELRSELKSLGHRFWPQRAEWIVLARKHLPVLKEVLSNLVGLELRQWFVNNVKGLGMKEASHFLRNVGFTDFAIVDFHIIDILSEYGVIDRVEKGKFTSKKYLEIEGSLRTLSNRLKLSLSELDLYLWFMETGKVLK